MLKLVVKISLLTSFLLQTACVIQQPATQGDPYYAPVLTSPETPVMPASGSIYSTTSATSLFTDTKASRVGDVITIILNENTSSSKSSNVTVDKESDISLAGDGNNTLLGTALTYHNMGIPTNLGGEREFDGAADADQSNSLRGNIAVTVADVLPNGNMIVRGEKWLTLNQGDEFIRVSGIVRPQDVSSDNMVRSTKLANARITYSGRGTLADSQRMGWLNRFFNSPIWPF